MSRDSQQDYAARLQEFLDYFTKNEQALRDVMKFEGLKGACLTVWKRSREAVVVELPKGGNMWRDEPLVISRSDAVEAIEATGVKVAP